MAVLSTATLAALSPRPGTLAGTQTTLSTRTRSGATATAPPASTQAPLSAGTWPGAKAAKTQIAKFHDWK